MGQAVGFFTDITPNQRDIMTLNRMFIKLFGQAANGFISFAQHHQAAGIFINSVNETKAGQGFGGNIFIFLLQMPGYSIN